MNKTITAFLSTVVLLCSFSAAYAEQYAVVFFNADWCGPCQEMKRRVWASDKARGVIKRKSIKFFSVNVDKYLALTESWQVTGYPTTVVLAAKGRVWVELYRFVGYTSPEEVCSELEKLN
jgi:thiol-disulfide isomerase/thioredoxin